MSFARLRTFTLLLFALTGPFAMGQWTKTVSQRGFVPGASFDVNGLDSINAVNGNMVLNIPITNLAAGQGGHSVDINLFYNSSHWTTYKELLTAQSGPVLVDRLAPDASWGVGFNYGLTVESRRGATNCDIPAQYSASNPPVNTTQVGPAEEMYQWRPRITLPDGSQHVLYLVGGDSVWMEADPTNPGWQPYDPAGAPSGCINMIYWAFPNSQTRPPVVNGSLEYVTTDGTYLRLKTEGQLDPNNRKNWVHMPWTLYLPDGRQVQGIGPETTAIIDRNGNQVTFSKTNSCFTPIATTYVAIRNDGPGANDRCIQIESSAIPQVDTIRQRGANGEELSWEVIWGSTVIDMEYPCTVLDGFQNLGPGTCNIGGPTVRTPIVTELRMHGFTCNSGPCDRSYLFEYAPLNNMSGQQAAEITKITVPTGATISYVYESVDPNNELVNPFGITDRTLAYNDPARGQVSEATHYAYDAPDYTVVTATGKGPVTHYFHPPYQYEGVGGHTYKIQQPDGSSTEQFWINNPSLNGSATINALIRREIRNEASFDGQSQISAVTDLITNTNGNVIEKLEYDWVNASNVPHPQSAPATQTSSFSTSGLTLVRDTKTSYYNLNSNQGEPTGNPGDPAALQVRATVFPTAFPASGGDADEYWHTRTLPLTYALALNLPATIAVKTAAGNTEAFTSFVYDAHGNLLRERRWQSATPGTPSVPLTDSNSIKFQHTYNSYGDPLTDTDPRTYVTTYQYNSSAHPYPTDLYEATGAGEQRHWGFGWSSYTGQRVTETDFDASPNLVTSVAYDNRGRLTSVSEGSGERVSYTSYDDLARTVTVNSPVNAALSGASDTTGNRTQTAFDQLGRKWATRNLTRGTESVEFTNPSGQNTYLISSNPYTNGSMGSTGWTLTTLDTSGRTTSVQYVNAGSMPAPWGGNNSFSGTVSTQYDVSTSTLTATVQVTDPASKVRKSATDGLGRLTSVVEAGTYTTSYGYDVRGNLTSVNQGGRTRSFVYDSLNRLTSATNPENGTIGYTYDGNGNVLTRTDARPTVTTTSYDGLNRPLLRSYSDSTPQVTYSYAGCQAGQLCSVSNSISGTSYQYDNLRRIIHSTQSTTGSGSYDFTYSYKKNDALESVTYPSGRKVNYAYDNSGQTTQIQGVLGSTTTNYTSATTPITYTPFGSVNSIVFGNGITEARQYNARLQPIQIQAGALMTLGFDYGTTDNNGNIQSQTIARQGASTVTQGYAYDALNRLTIAAANPSQAVTAISSCTQINGGTTQWCQKNDYDQWGNRWVATAEQFGALLPQRTNEVPSGLGSYNTLNRIAAFGYDSAGNVLNAAGVRTSQYDGENRQTQVTTSGNETTNYVYDGEGRRIKKITCAGASACTEGASGTTTTIFVYDASGQLAAEYGGPAPTDTGRRYLFGDHLGSTRLVATDSGTVDKTYDYLPFGEELGGFYPGDSSVRGRESIKFTGQERDAETGLDFFGARYYSDAQGRFTSADAPLLDQREDDPQSWNLYTYGRNNPLRYTDPTGNCAVEGKEYGFWWCVGHALGIQQTEKEQAAAIQRRADANRAAMAKWHGFTINGQNPADIAKNGTNQQVIDAYKSGINFLIGRSLAPCPQENVGCGVIPIGPPGELALVAEGEGGIVAQNGTTVTGFTRHGLDRAIGDTWKRAGTRPQAILDALKNPIKIVTGVDSLGRPYEIFTGRNARVVVNPQSGEIVSVNPRSGAGASLGR